MRIYRWESVEKNYKVIKEKSVLLDLTKKLNKISDVTKC